jgi:hypothetical protein
MANWYEMLKEMAENDGEEVAEIVCTLSKKELEEEFNSGYGGSEGRHFTAWGKNWVYFPIVYDGAEWVGHAPRNPCNISMAHQGGE